VHYDAAVAATVTAACNLGAENRENRRVKMKRGSSQGKWGNVSSTHIYIHSTCTRASTRARRVQTRAYLGAACTKTTGSGRKLTPFPTFHSTYCFSPLLTAVPLRSVSFLSSNTASIWNGYAVVQPHACSNREELIGLYHVKRFSSTKLLHGCLVSDRVNGRWNQVRLLRTAMVIFIHGGCFPAFLFYNRWEFFRRS